MIQSNKKRCCQKISGKYKWLMVKVFTYTGNLWKALDKTLEYKSEKYSPGPVLGICNNKGKRNIG